MTDEIGKFCRPNLFLISVKTLKIWAFELHIIAICKITNPLIHFDYFF